MNNKLDQIQLAAIIGGEGAVSGKRIHRPLLTLLENLVAALRKSGAIIAADFNYK